MRTNVCQQCGKNFETPNRKKMYCSPECRRAADSLIIEWIYHPDIERQIECLSRLLDIPYVRPSEKPPFVAEQVDAWLSIWRRLSAGQPARPENNQGEQSR